MTRQIRPYVPVMRDDPSYRKFEVRWLIKFNRSRLMRVKAQIKESVIWTPQMQGRLTQRLMPPHDLPPHPRMQRR